jgi:NADH-quinone oxidoreductase subunit H
MDSVGLLIACAKSAVLLGLVFGVALPYVYLLDRRLGAFTQGRLGPNRVGPVGLGQPWADMLKLLFKGDMNPQGRDRFLHALAPLVALLPALMILAAIPFGEGIVVGGRHIGLQIVDLDVGVLYILSMVALAGYGALLAGWSANDKYALLGGLRAVGQRLGCGLALGLAVVGVLALSGSARLSEVILAQTSMVGPLPCWNVWRQPLGLLVFVVAWLVQIDRPPFGLGAAGSAVAGGFLTHYGGARRLLFQWTEYVYLLAGSALVVTFYGGGWHLPYLATVGPGSLWQELLKVAVFGLKTACVLVAALWVRWILPRLHSGQVGRLNKRILLPAALLNALGTAWIMALVR